MLVELVLCPLTFEGGAVGSERKIDEIGLRNGYAEVSKVRLGNELVQPASMPLLLFHQNECFFAREYAITNLMPNPLQTSRLLALFYLLAGENTLLPRR